MGAIDENEMKPTHRPPRPSKLVGIVQSLRYYIYNDFDDLYENENENLADDRICSRLCFGIMISITFIFSGIVATIYGYMLPYLYHLLDTNQRKYKYGDVIAYLKYRDIFVILGICMIIFGTVMCIFLVCLATCASPKYVEKNTRKRRDSHYSYSPMDYKPPP